MQSQSTPQIDSVLAGGEILLERLWRACTVDASLPRYAYYLVTRDYHTPSHLRDLDRVFSKLPEDARGEALTRLLAYMAFEMGRVHAGPAERGTFYYADDTNRCLDALLGLPSLRPLCLEAGLWPKIQAYLRTAVEYVNDGELWPAIQDDLIKNIGHAVERLKAAYLAEKTAKGKALKLEIIAAAMHPKRVEALLESGGFEALEQFMV